MIGSEEVKRITSKLEKNRKVVNNISTTRFQKTPLLALQTKDLRQKHAPDCQTWASVDFPRHLQMILKGRQRFVRESPKVFILAVLGLSFEEVYGLPMTFHHMMHVVAVEFLSC